MENKLPANVVKNKHVTVFNWLFRFPIDVARDDRYTDPPKRLYKLVFSIVKFSRFSKPSFYKLAIITRAVEEYNQIGQNDF